MLGCAVLRRLAAISSESNQQDQRGDGHDQTDDLVDGERFAKHSHADGREQKNHRHRIDHTDRRQLQVAHHEDPAERGRGIDRETQVKPLAVEWVLAALASLSK